MNIHTCFSHFFAKDPIVMRDLQTTHFEIQKQPKSNFQQQIKKDTDAEIVNHLSHSRISSEVEPPWIGSGAKRSLADPLVRTGKMLKISKILSSKLHHKKDPLSY